MHSHSLYRIYVENAQHRAPPESPRLAARLREAVRRPLVLHVSRRWIGVKVFTPREPLDTVAERVASTLGGRLLYTAAGEPPLRAGMLARCYLGYMKANMFWEAHVAGEAIWARAGLLGRAMAVVAGSLAKVQEGALRPALAMAEKAVGWLRGEGVKLDMDGLRRLFAVLYEEGWVDAAPVALPLAEAAAERLGERL